MFSKKPDPVIAQIRDALPPLTETEHSRGYREACECISLALRQGGQSSVTVERVIGLALAAYKNHADTDDAQVIGRQWYAGDGDLQVLRSRGLL